jgi:cytochrome c-type biogenesis protein CcmE
MAEVGRRRFSRPIPDQSRTESNVGTYLKFAICGVLIAGGVIWLAIEAQSEGGTATYVHVEDIKSKLGEAAYSRRLQITGKVKEGSIRYEGDDLYFTILGDRGGELPAHFAPNQDVLPDNFVDGAMVIVQGDLKREGHLEARKIQTKCSSKYESDYNDSSRAFMGTATGAAETQPK